LNDSQGNQNANSRQQEKAMSAKTIGIIQVKGGAGRSTVSTNLAGELSKLGKTVLIDCDIDFAEYWDGSGLEGVRLLAEMGRAKLEGDQVDSRRLGRHGEVDPSRAAAT